MSDAAGRHRPRPGGPAVRQGARRRAADRRPLALGPPPREPRGERPRAVVAADGPLARRRRPRPRRGLRPSPKADSTSPAVELRVRVRDAEYRPLDNAKVALKITLPGGDDLYPRRRARRPRGRHLLGDVRHQAARPLSGRSRPRRPPTARPSASARPAGPRSPPPTSSPGWSPIASSSNRSPTRTKGEVVDGDRPRRVRRQPLVARRPDHRAVDLAPLAPAPRTSWSRSPA